MYCWQQVQGNVLFCVLFRAAVVPVQSVRLLLGGRGVEQTLYSVCIVVFTLDAKLLAISQYSEGPAIGHPDTGFSSFPCVYKQMLRWFPTFQ